MGMQGERHKGRNVRVPQPGECGAGHISAIGGWDDIPAQVWCMGDYEIADVAEGVKISRMEMPSATFSFTFCSQNRTAENGSAVNGEDEAWAVADKAISYFKHAGQDDFLALGVAVVDVGQAQDRTTLLVDEAARRVGFDVQIRYTRIDERETASIEKIKI